MTDDLWQEYAQWWIDGFTEGADPEYVEQIMPLAATELAGARRVLDVGCGDGQITRLAAGLEGVDLAVGIDPTWNQIRVAVERGHARAESLARSRSRSARSGFARAAAAALPFGEGSFDAVVVCLVFEHVEHVDDAIAEIARVLEPGGRFCFFLNHPLLQTPGSGWIDDQVLDPPEQYWRIGPYLTEAATVEEVEQGVHIRFIHRPLSRYVNALAEHGLLVERMVEPAPPPGFLALAEEYADAATVPRLLYLRMRKQAGVSLEGACPRSS
jgi:SAM-dependent methyltransferase